MPAAAKRLFALCFAALVCAAAPAWSSQDGQVTTQECLGCHDFGDDSPVHAVMSGSHGVTDTSGVRGCQDCHGASGDHAHAPTQVAPAVSFGPRWSASASDQDSQCLACHEDNIAAHWRDALHMVNGLTCVTCHDIHVEEDKVLFEKQQAEVCTVCHKAQKQGIHGMQKRASRNPPCTTCHNPHDHGDAQAQMLTNQSAGCSHCHDLVRMSQRDSVSDKAKSYHKVMARHDATCIQCHQGVAHAPADSVPPMHPVPRKSRSITLFYPGIADSTWLLESHPGSQPLRQGAPCQRCHRGEEAAIGEARASDRIAPATRDVRVSFAVVEQDQLEIVLDWQGAADDQAVSVMWGGPSSEDFRRGGCFAACHSDMPGMSRDHGADVGKYLRASRSQLGRVGQPAIVKGEAELEALMSEGVFAELWRVPLQGEGAQRALVLADARLAPTDLIYINKTFRDGRWRVALRREMNHTESGVSFNAPDNYTFGIAIHGAGNPGGSHWVSLPLTLSFGGIDTDFTAE